MLIVAHRGASAKAPENTLPAFAEALRAGADGAEFDVRLTADDRLVLMHDDDIQRVVGRPGRVSAMTFEELRAVYPDITTFEQVVDLLAGKTTLFVEVKGAWTGERYIPAAPVVDAIAPFLAGVDAVVSSFDPDAVSHARAVLSAHPTGLASLELVEAGWTIDTAAERGFDECHLPEAQVDAAVIERARAAGKRVLAWTVNDPARARALAAIGCDGIFTDDPGAMREALSR